MKRLVPPDSSLLSAEFRAASSLMREQQREITVALEACPPIEGTDPVPLRGIRDRHAQAYYGASAYRRLRERYDVTMRVETVGGIYTEVFVPEEGIAQQNARRILVNLHGGAFQTGSRMTSHAESIPIAAVGRIKVVSVDYRMAPEWRFPAAREDTVAVYRALLTEYAPENIGIYGCSAGAVLITQTIASLQKERLPLPAAIGLLFGAGSFWTEGDSGQFAAALGEGFRGTSLEHPYFKDTDPDDPMAFPVRSGEMLAGFPPSLLISATRDLALSSVVQMHRRLIEQGVEAHLHIWEGLDHAFHCYADLPQSRQVYELVTGFFDTHLRR